PTLATLLVQVAGKVLHELEFLVQVFIAILAGWQEQAGNTHLVEIGLQITPIAIGCFKTETADDGLGLLAGINRHAALAGHFGLARVQEITIQLKRRVIQFESGSARVLQADHVGILGLQPAEKTSLGCCLNAIHVHIDDPHKWPQKSRVGVIRSIICARGTARIGGSNSQKASIVSWPAILTANLIIPSCYNAALR